MFSGIEGIWREFLVLLRSASWRGGLLVLIAFEVCITLAFLGLYGMVSYHVERDHYRLLNERFALLVERPPQAADIIVEQLRDSTDHPLHQNFRYHVRDHKGKVLFSNLPREYEFGRAFFPPVTLMWIDDDDNPFGNRRLWQQSWRFGEKRENLLDKRRYRHRKVDIALISSTWPVPGGEITIAVFSFGYGLFLEVLFTWLRVLLVVTAILGLVMTGWQARRNLKRLESVRTLADTIMAGDVATRLYIDTDKKRLDEYDHLRHSLNAMLDRINEGIDAVKAVSDHIAHDLRTPLALLRSRVEQMQISKENRQQLVEEIDRILQIFQSLINVTRLERGVIRMQQQSVDLAVMAEDLRDLYDVIAEEEGISLSCECTPDCTIFADPHQLFQALVNIVDNAVKFTQNGGAVAVAITKHDDGVMITIDDSGPGIAQDLRERAFNRYESLKSDKPGSGLGLTLARAVIIAHKGTITLTDSTLGGLRVVISLPQSSGSDKPFSS
ncbi:MAG: HAMP domain-containing sensor histidine kinase [Pseudomonadota bacterium]